MNQNWIKFLPSFVRHKFESRQNLQKIVENTGWLFLDKILRMGVGVIVGVWVARYLGPEQYGAFCYAGAFVALFAAIAPLGIDSIVVRDLVRDPAGTDEVMGTAFFLKSAGALVSVLLTIAAILVVKSGDRLTCWLVAIISAGTLAQSFNIIEFWFQSQVQSKFTVYARNAVFIIMSIVKVAMIMMGAPLITFAFAVLVENIMASAALVTTYVLNGFSFRKWRMSMEKAVTLLRESWPLILSQLSILVYMKIDQLMLGEMVGAKSVGVYSAALRVSEVWYFIPLAITASVTPSIIRTKNNEPLYYAKLQRLFHIMAALFYVIALPISFFSNYIIVKLYGATYSAAGAVLAIHIWSGLFVFLGVARQIWVINEGYTKSSLLTTSLGAVINVALNLYLIPRYQEIGAAVATLIAYSFSDYFFTLLYKPFRRVGMSMTKSIFLVDYLNNIRSWHLRSQI